MTGRVLVAPIGDMRMSGRWERGCGPNSQPGRHQIGVELYSNGNVNGCKKSLWQDGRMRHCEGWKAIAMDNSLVVAYYGDREVELMVAA